jgi:hypothetical protein
MKRNLTAILGMMVALAALVFVVTGCTSNPLSPAIDNTGGESNSPGTEAMLSEAEIDGDLINDDIMTGGSMEKERPDIVEFEPGMEPEVEIPERVDAADFTEDDFTR